MSHMTRSHVTTVLLATVSLCAGGLGALALARRAPLERMPIPAPAAPEHLRAAVMDADFSPATPAEARDALARVFGSALETGPADARVGDFNRDGSPDLGVIVRARPGSTAALADPLANWTVQDCAPGPAEEAGEAAAHVRDGEPLLAIVHGQGPRGWRDAESRQAYLVRGAPGGRAVADLLAWRPARRPVVLWMAGHYVCPSVTAEARGPDAERLAPPPRRGANAR
jgi:hypothetical protein